MLTQGEIKRKDELLQVYRTTGYLIPAQAQELKDLIERDNTIEESVKLLLIFALVAMIIIAAKK